MTTLETTTDLTRLTAAVSSATADGPSPLPPDRPRRIQSRTAEDTSALVGAGVSSLALTWLLYSQILPFSGAVGFFLFWYLAFVLLYGLVTSLSQPMPIVVDRLIATAVQAVAAVVAAAVIWTLSFVFVKGFPAYRHTNFYTHDMGGVRPTDALTHGGISHALIGSLIEISIAVVISLPLGIVTAVYMTEVGGRLARVVRTVVEAMTALPDLVAGLFIYAVLVVALHGGRTGLAAALALSITMLPIIARSSEVVLRVVPNGLREASAALGAPRWRTVLRVVLPTARPGLATALILGIARGIGETAPVLVTSGASSFFTVNPTGNPMNSLPLFAYNALRSGEEGSFVTRGYGAAAVLMAVVLILFIVVRLLSRQRSSRS